MRHARPLAAFCWDFIAGEDWRLAAGIAIAISSTALLVHEGLSAWWLMPIAVALLLARSLPRAARQRG